MKRIAVILLAALLTASAVPALGDMSSADKDQCLLASRNCADAVDSIQQKMQRLQNEIKKGTKVYTPAELKALEQKLKEINELVDSMMKPTGGK